MNAVPMVKTSLMPISDLNTLTRAPAVSAPAAGPINNQQKAMSLTAIAATLYELSSRPLAKDEWVPDYKLEDNFPPNNSWWIGTVQSIEDDEDYDWEMRLQEINNLRMELPEGYDVRTDKIIVYDPTLYWKTVVRRLTSLAIEAEGMDPVDGNWEPLSWWKNFVDRQLNTLIYYRDMETLMTLNEFLLFMIRQKENVQFLYIGGIFDIGDE